MAVSKPNPVASSSPVEGRPGVVQDWTADGQPYGQPHARQSANLDPGFSAPTASKPAAKVTPKPKITAAQMPEPLKKQGTQTDHHVTDNNNHTRPISPAQKQEEAKRPAVGNDKAVAKKVKGPSNNNGYTN
jgi:hypothetical protein